MFFEHMGGTSRFRKCAEFGQIRVFLGLFSSVKQALVFREASGSKVFGRFRKFSKSDRNVVKSRMLIVFF